MTKRKITDKLEYSVAYFNIGIRQNRMSCICKENHFQLILQHAAYHQIKGFDFAYNYKTTFDFLYM